MTLGTWTKLFACRLNLFRAESGNANLSPNPGPGGDVCDFCKGRPIAAPVAASTNGKRSSKKQKKPFKVKLQNAEDDPILAKLTHAEMEAMVPVYRILYELENSNSPMSSDAGDPVSVRQDSQRGDPQ